MCFFLDHGCFVCPMGVVGLVDGEDGVPADMEGDKADSENDELPDPGMPLKYECEIPPEGLSGRGGVEFPGHLWFSTYIISSSYRTRASQFESKE